AAEILRAERERLERAGLACPVVSGGGTGTLDLAGEAGALTEVQAGSYVLMDTTYERLGLPFEQALFCRATVVSRSGTRVVLNAGLKALSAEYGMPGAVDPGLEVISLSDEHATATVPEDCPLRVGDTTLLVPAHVDPTVNLHPALLAVAQDGGVEAWPVDARR
ncbi:MAG: low-specificity D-threonine aldolase, partial [Solirubrobacteraceae bacterium]|nr:low-specificity D-threonine aldolase [Solirubrobacteraceae bacterium]